MRLLKTILFFWLYVVLVKSAYSQNYFETYQHLSNTSYTLSNHRTDSLIDLAIFHTKTRDAIRISHDHSVFLYKEKKYQQAIRFIHRELSIYKKNAASDKLYVDALYNLAKSYQKLKQKDSSSFYFNKIIGFNDDLNPSKKALALSSLGLSHASSNDYYKAADYYTKSISLLQKINKPKWLFKRYISLSNVYERINTAEALSHKIALLKKALALSESNTMRLSHKDYYSLYNALATYYNNTDSFDFDRSKEYQLAYLEIAKSYRDSLAVATAYGNLGNLYSTVKNDSALFFFNQSLAYSPSINVKANTTSLISEYYLNLKNPRKAIDLANQTLSLLLDTTIDSTSVLTHELLRSGSNKFTMLRTLNLKANSFIDSYHRKKSLHYLQEALSNLRTADTLISILLNESSYQNSKLYWKNKAASIYNKAVYCTRLLQLPDETFYFMEKNKAVLLTQQILTNAKKLKLPNALISKERFLKKSIAQIEKESTKIDTLFDLKHSYEILKDSIENLYPNYQKDISKTVVYSLKDIQHDVYNNTATLSYIWDTNSSLDMIQGMLITKHHTSFFEIPEVSHLKHLIKQYQQFLSKPFSTQSEVDSFINIANQLYRKLIPEKIAKLISNQHLIIIPDGHLQNVPFEALLATPNPEDYLIKHHMVSYAYSMSFLKHNATLNRSTNDIFTGFAPISFTDTELSDLPSSNEELNTITTYMDGQVFKGDSATSAHFKKYSATSKILHLATHSNANRHSWIAFADAKISADELALIPTNADLVVLSSCDSSLGQFYNGEGVYGLVRSFFYAGANSVLSSLWKVNDKATSELMSNFYHSLSVGSSKVEALHFAKLSYLKSHQLSEASPYYWASTLR